MNKAYLGDAILIFILGINFKWFGASAELLELNSNKRISEHYLQLKLYKMEDNFVNSVVTLYKEKDWRAIVNKYRDYPERNKLLWVFPTEENFKFLRKCLEDFGCDKVMSVGCGSGLLEWMITEATGIPVTGVEVDGAWWRCKYAPPTFIPLLFTPNTLDKNIVELLKKSDATALLFCYFNNGPAFKNYLEHFSGKVLIIIGPEGKGVHTDPKPFDNVPHWSLYAYDEVGNTRDFIAVYRKNKTLINNKEVS